MNYHCHMNYPRQQSQLYKNNDRNKPSPVLTFLLSLAFFLSHNENLLIITDTDQLVLFCAVSLATTARIRSH